MVWQCPWKRGLLLVQFVLFIFLLWLALADVTFLFFSLYFGPQPSLGFWLFPRLLSSSLLSYVFMHKPLSGVCLEICCDTTPCPLAFFFSYSLPIAFAPLLQLGNMFSWRPVLTFTCHSQKYTACSSSQMENKRVSWRWSLKTGSAKQIEFCSHF